MAGKRHFGSERQFWNNERSDAPGLRVVSRRVIEQSARDSHQGPSREIPGVQAGCALVDTTVWRHLAGGIASCQHTHCYLRKHGPLDSRMMRGLSSNVYPPIGLCWLLSI